MLAFDLCKLKFAFLALHLISHNFHLQSGLVNPYVGAQSNYNVIIVHRPLARN